MLWWVGLPGHTSDLCRCLASRADMTSTAACWGGELRGVRDQRTCTPSNALLHTRVVVVNAPPYTQAAAGMHMKRM